MTERTIRMTAKDLAASDWDKGTHSERFRKFWPNVKQFVARNWPTYVPMAKEILVAMLTDEKTPQTIKEGIYDALIEENVKNANVKGAVVGRGKMNLNPLHPGRMERKIFHEGD